jgi:secreted PhoX family phosphatase
VRAAVTPDHRAFVVAIEHPGLTDTTTYAASGSRGPERRADMPLRPSVAGIDRANGGKVRGGAPLLQ